jgi:3-dehydroquinate synthetase
MNLGRRLRLVRDEYPIGRLMPYIRRDKKVAGGRIHFVCITGVGRSAVRPMKFEALLGD